MSKRRKSIDDLKPKQKEVKTKQFKLKKKKTPKGGIGSPNSVKPPKYSKADSSFKDMSEYEKMLQKEYSKQRRRIINFIKRNEKRGFVFPETVIPPTVNEMKQKGKITIEDVEKLIDVRPKALYNTSQYGGEYSYGELISGKTGAHLARKRQYINGEMIETYVEPLSFHYYDKVRDEIMEMENETFDLSEHKYGLLELMEEKFNDYYDEYDNYLKTVYPMIGVLINELNYDSHPLQINKHTGQLSKLLAYQQDGLTDEQAYRLAELTNSTVGDFL